MAEMPEDWIFLRPTISPLRVTITSNSAQPARPSRRKGSGYRRFRFTLSRIRLNQRSPVISRSPGGAPFATTPGFRLGVALGIAGLGGGNGLAIGSWTSGAGTGGGAVVRGSAGLGVAGVGSGAVSGTGSLAGGVGLGVGGGGSLVGAEAILSSGPDRRYGIDDGSGG